MQFKAIEYTAKENWPDWIPEGQEPPPNMRPISAEEFWLEFRSFQPRGMLHLDWWQGEKYSPEERRKTAVAFLYDGNQGIGMITSEGTMRYTKGFYPPVEYFKFAKCLHVFSDKVVGNCLTRYTCQKCNCSYEVDSSD